jgi:Undecaprenyl-phosphate galactose phosphotransferase WbaP
MSTKEYNLWHINKHNLRMSLWFLASDLLGIIIAGVLAYFFRILIEGEFQHPEIYLRIVWIFFVFPLSYAINGLYPGVGITPVEEMRRATMSTSIVWISITALLFLTQSGIIYSRMAFSLFGFFLILLIPILRFIARRVGTKLKIWGEPVALIGFGDYGKKVLHFLSDNRFYGFLPKLVIDGQEDKNEILFEGNVIPRIDSEAFLQDKLMLNRQGITTVILVPNEVPPTLRKAIGSESDLGIKHLILISELGWFGGSAVIPYDMNGILGLGVQHKLLNPGERILKRIIDLLITLIGGIIGFPVMLICSILIHLDSPGPIFYSQKRIGFKGKEIRVWKFRTMIKDADKVLESYLNENPEIKEEWAQSQKIKNDPRVTRVGKFLRKTSMDELPQMWNVLLGNMSWVGPRPIVQDEISRYQESFSMYIQVHPGITGLWQSSGRSSTNYNYRVNLDEYYIRHWSLWLDFYILLRTVQKVIKHEGAY